VNGRGAASRGNAKDDGRTGAIPVPMQQVEKPRRNFRGGGGKTLTLGDKGRTDGSVNEKELGTT